MRFNTVPNASIWLQLVIFLCTATTVHIDFELTEGGNPHTIGMAEAAGAISALTTACDDQISGSMEALSVGVGEALAIAGNPAFVTALAGSVAGSSNGADEGRSARRAMLEQLRRECGSEEEFDTARTQPIWTEVDTCSSSSSADGPSAAELELIRVENREYFQRLVAEKAPEWLTVQRIRELRDRSDLAVRGSPFFWDFEGRLEAGRRLGGGGQAEIYEALYDGHVNELYVLKVFRSDSCLVDLQRLWVSEAGRAKKRETYCKYPGGLCCVSNGTLLKDGRFAFVMDRYWGDLRKVIDLQILKDVETHQNPPFPLFITAWMMMQIAYGMMRLHDRGILHRDLKAANVLVISEVVDYLRDLEIVLHSNERFQDMFYIFITDFETSEGVMGTGFWRAPEILHALKSKVKNVHLDANVWTEKVDVYGYAMTSYEILTGCIPFQNRAANDYDGVIGGERPPLPDYVDPEIQELVRRCWHSEPSMRPTFEEVGDFLVAFLRKRREGAAHIPEMKEMQRLCDSQKWWIYFLDSGAWSSWLDERDEEVET